MPNIPKWVQKLTEWTALFAIILTGGSYWINTEVERRMNELAIDPASAPAVVTLQAEVANIEASQIRIEGKVDAFSAKFMEYLQRQVN